MWTDNKPALVLCAFMTLIPLYGLHHRRSLLTWWKGKTFRTKYILTPIDKLGNTDGEMPSM